VLSEEGYRVQTASNGRAALGLVRNEVPDLILLDMRMPILNGFGFAQEYQTLPPPHAPLLLMTADRPSPEWSAVKAVGLLPKPFSIDELLRLVALHAPCSPPK
jgi:two-component system, chemotaxis family, chemotaxis protein CheY